MGFIKSRWLSFLLVGYLFSFFIFKIRTVFAASQLAAWELNSNGELNLRTSRNALLKAYFQYPNSRKGTRIWIDFQGELVRPRKISGNGIVKEVRLGKPKEGITRLVVEFNPSINLYPSKLKLIGLAPGKWKLKLPGLPSDSYKTIGEGNLAQFSTRKVALDAYKTTFDQINPADLPSVPRGRFRVVIDPGHGGPDSGAVGVGGVKETDVVLDISLRVTRLLESKGVKVDLTRSTEIDLDLPPRVAMANRLGATAFISIHANASRNVRRDVNGIETFYFSGWKGLRLATSIQNELLRASPRTPDRGVRKGRYFVIRRTAMPAVLVEVGFLTGRFDGPLLAKSSHRKKISFAIAKGIINYLREQN